MCGPGSLVSSRHHMIHSETPEKSKVRRSQACDWIPTLDSLETCCVTSGVAATDNVVQTLVPLGVQPRVQESERRKSCGDTGVVQERDHSGESLISRINISEH